MMHGGTNPGESNGNRSAWKHVGTLRKLRGLKAGWLQPTHVQKPMTRPLPTDAAIRSTCLWGRAGREVRHAPDFGKIEVGVIN
jgi:hypothetical protein